MAGGATNFRDALLPALDVMRGIPGLLGLRRYTVTVLLRQWSGSRAGLGTNVDQVTGVKIDLGTYQTKIRQLTERDVVASGGIYSTQDLEVGPITPPYAGSSVDGDAITVFDPVVSANPSDVFFNVVGPGYPVGGAWFKKRSQDVTKNFRFTFIVERTAEVP